MARGRRERKVTSSYRSYRYLHVIKKVLVWARLAPIWRMIVVGLVRNATKEAPAEKRDPIHIW